MAYAHSLRLELCLSLGLGRVGPGADVRESEGLAGVAERSGFVAAALIGRDAGDGDAEALVVGDGGLEEGDGAFLLFVGHDLTEGEARGVIDADVDIFPSCSPAIAAAKA